MPIIPTFLYTIEYEGANSSAAPHQPESPPSAIEDPPFSPMSSYFDTSTMMTLGSPRTMELQTGTSTRHPQHPPMSSPSPNGCPQGEEFLTQENMRVGLLFASKALVQLLVNPSVGLLTNRYVCNLLRSSQVAKICSHIMMGSGERIARRRVQAPQ